jgi:ABC-type Mn2+/Zn2+ transport system permease subunit
MIAAIITTGLFGTVLVIRRKDVLTVAIGVALLAVAAGVLWDHWEWLSE